MLQHESLADTAEPSLNWSEDAPRGGKTVLNRILKESATVPLFFAQTLISSLRDVGYNHTTSALCEHVDNAIEAGATEIRAYFRQSGKKGEYRIDAAVYDNGRGMEPNVLKVATSIGGSMNYNNRDGIGRFGMGMKTAALSMSPVMELYTWQEPGAIYSMTLDVEAIGKDRSNQVNVPEPILRSELPYELAQLFMAPMAWPKDHAQQELFAVGSSEQQDWLGSHGTIVYMPECDRLFSAKAQTLGEHAVGEMARIYRRHISKGLRLYINNRRGFRSDVFDGKRTTLDNVVHARRELARLVLQIPAAELSLLAAVAAGMSYNELARQHDLSPAALRTRVTRLRRTLYAIPVPRQRSD